MTYNQFSADAGSAGDRDELDINVVTKLSEHSTLGLRYADFNGDDGFVDVTRFLTGATLRVL